MTTRQNYLRKPEWLRKRLNTGDAAVRQVLAENRLHTVCEEADCPNLHECWGDHKTATFMVLGDTCTRRCGFCNIATGRPGAVDPLEPKRLADSVAEMGLDFVVITMVARDDLPDGGAEMMARCVRAVRHARPGCKVEVLPSDFAGSAESLATLLAARPEVLCHNLETVRRLTRSVRSRSTYERSLEFLRRARELQPELLTKSSLMIGLGETRDEIAEAMDDLLAVGVDVLTLGQYLQPSRQHLPVQKYWEPSEFAALAELAHRQGFAHCESGPLVRSSYKSDEVYAAAMARRRH